MNAMSSNLEGLIKMVKQSMDGKDSLEDFLSREISFNEISKMVYVMGNGPAVIVMPEMPGISPQIVRFCRHPCLAQMVMNQLLKRGWPY
jgi:hypothetical protein